MKCTSLLLLIVSLLGCASESGQATPVPPGTAGNASSADAPAVEDEAQQATEHADTANESEGIDATPVAEPDESQGTADSDLESILGTWRITTGRYNGEEVADLTGGEMIFDEQQVSFAFTGQKGKFNYKLDSTQNPHWIDLQNETGDTIMGIYRLDGETLVICHHDVDSVRPTEFRSEAGDRLSLVTLQRVENEAE